MQKGGCGGYILVGEKLGEALGEESGEVGNEQGVVGVEDGPAQRFEGGDAVGLAGVLGRIFRRRGGGGSGGGGGVVSGEGGG